uniref:Chromodomain-helicase-DNA-binding protein 6-9 tri-helical domain-containing protein n=1 Tax=Panagrolaimus superbus TaxID=310955 RepID=A0A914Z9J0_9BILA
MLLAWGWGRWSLIKEKLENNLEEREIEHMARCFLLHCLREYRGDEKSRDYVWKLITPKGENVIKSDDKKDTNIFQQGWASNPEYNPPGFAIDHSFRRHHEIITEKWAEKCANPEISHTEINIKAPALGEFPPNTKWDSECDKSFLIGVYRHGNENNELIKADEKLCFIEKLEDGGFLSTTDINNRFKKLLLQHIRQTEMTLQSQTSIRNMIKQNSSQRGNWSVEEEDDFIRVLINYGVWDQTVNDKVNIKWTKFRERATSLAKKTDAQMMENLYCVLARCSKVQNSALGEADEARAEILSRIPAKKCTIILHRLTLMRKVHINGMAKDENYRRTHIRMIPLLSMPKGWTYELDERLFNVADTFGVNQLRKKLSTLSEFKTIELPSNKELWQRLYEIVLTLESGKYGGTVDHLQYDEESDDEREDELWVLALSNAGKQAAALPTATPESSSGGGGGGGGSSRRTQNKKKANAAAAAAAAAAATAVSVTPSSSSSSSKKDINSAHQNFVKQMDQAALQQQNYLMMHAAASLAGAAGSSTGGSGGSGGGSGKQTSNSAAATNDIVAQIAQLQAILQFTSSAGSGVTNASFNKAIEDAMNLSKKDSAHSTPTTSTSKTSNLNASTPSSSQKVSTTSSVSQSQKASTSTASASTPSTSAASAAAALAYPQMNCAEAEAFEKAALDQLGIGFAELMVLQSLDPSKF